MEDDVFPQTAEGLADRLKAEATQNGEWWRSSAHDMIVEQFEKLLTRGVPVEEAYGIVYAVARVFSAEFGC
jgi:hypothetical protein